ncbi:amidoligase family protein [Marinibactrum halimedae]|uniref:Alpha-L-fucosidase n=1 Tax=Marinibactrum halimedae TaxID=1444977 RepID=A0AA37T3V9_9GAMM|nr:amidoligase family protein [Marinibactrum halimedae]MCD9458177.1 amidoligase family protein [Marinibactrum halimedae]GLS25111.1 hypothetical protein GCM10007877_08250 [Marinibactrum halimedae]
MNDELRKNWLPIKVETFDGKIRKVGVEIELSGLSIETMANCICDLYGGDIQQINPLEYKVNQSEFGRFKVELDASYMKNLAVKQEENNSEEGGLSDRAFELMTKAAEQLVPWEIVTPPIKLNQIERLEDLVTILREKGALGTRNALHHAFGVHLNPELPDLEVSTIVRYLRAYFCLYDWIVEQENVDITRRLTMYVKHFDSSYIELVLDSDYNPSMEQLIDDYLEHNPTRNRSLDLLPLFVYLDEARVRKVVDDTRIKPRPTFHYRLPNCDIDNPDWSLYFPWCLWLEVEKLAHRPKQLKDMIDEYLVELARMAYPIESRWATRAAGWVAGEPLYE